MTPFRQGLLAVLAAAVIWGAFGLYYRELSHVPAGEVLAHRILWSLVFFAGLLAAQGRLGLLRAALRRPVAGRVLLAALAISVNWLVYIRAIQTGHALEASFGYYILPLVAVLLGVAVFKERLSRGEWAAVALAAAGVLILGAGLRVTPWTSLIIALSFGLYAMVKKAIPLDADVSVGAEVAVLAPLALAWILWPHAAVPGQRAHFGADLPTTLLLLGAGPATALPLILFSHGSQRLPLSTLGLVQYVNPTIQFGVAILVFRQPLTGWHATAFVLIWIALIVFARVEPEPEPEAGRRAVRVTGPAHAPGLGASPAPTPGRASGRAERRPRCHPPALPSARAAIRPR